MSAPLDATVRRSLSGARLVIASHNQGKVSEIADLLAPFGVSVTSADALGLPEAEETGETFAENAVLKATAAAAAGHVALADDSGLCVDALDGAPGIRSARWAGEGRDFGLAMRRVHEALGGRDEDWRAHFYCALALAWPDGTTRTFEGRVDGRLTWPPRGDNGFGYDPIFIPDGHTQTFGEMDPALKHAISHRARAFKALIDACFNA